MFKSIRMGEIRKDEGFTLPEMLISVAIFSVLMLMMATVMLMGMSNIRQFTTKSNVSNSQQTAMEWVSRLIRYTSLPEDGTDYPILIATDRQFKAYTYSGTGSTDIGPYIIDIRFEEGRGLVAGIQEPSVNEFNELVYVNEPSERVVLEAESIVTERPLFRYFDRSGAEIVPEDGSTTLSITEMNRVRSVGVLLDNTDERAELTQTIGLMNLE